MTGYLAHPTRTPLPETLKLTFDDRVPLQLMLDAVGKREGAAALERETGAVLHVRGNEVTIEGDSEAKALIERLLRQIYGLAKNGRSVQPADVGRALEVLRFDPGADLKQVFDDEVLPQALEGKGVAPRSVNQKQYVEYMRSHSLTFGVGPAGTGKTFLAVAMAVHALLEQKVRRLIISRPAIEAGENLGFLPGTLEQKISPYLRPLYDALYDMLEPARVHRMLDQEIIEIAPLAYMRGRTLNEAFVILDEAQNTTREQMKMFLTRIGQGTRAVVTGDPSQVDLPSGQKSGLAHALRVLHGVSGIAVCQFLPQDVMRHPLVQAIVEAYERDLHARQEARAASAAAGRSSSKDTGNRHR